MDYPTSPLEKLLQDVKDYVVIQRQLITTVASKKGADVAYVVVAGVIFLLLGLFIAIFLSFTIAYGLAMLLNNLFLGFLIVTLFYVLILVVVLIFRDRLIKIPILRAFLNLFNNNKPTSNEPVA